MKRNSYIFFAGIATLFFLLVPTNLLHAQAYAIEYGAVWKYLDDGSDQGTAWRELAFNDSSWAEGPGPLGYNEDEATVLYFGEDPANKFITYYLRKEFSISNASSATSVNTEFMVDDGLIIYLNGQELARMGLADSISLDSVNYLTTFEDADVGEFEGQPRSEEMVYNLSNSAAAALLNEGENVIAVEVHQSEPGSSDIRFNLQVTIDGDVIVTGVERTNVLPNGYSLSNAYPNPFNPSTTISFSLPQRNNVKLQVFDALGRCVATLAEGPFEAGTYKYNWNAKGFASGVYIYTLSAGQFVSSKKLILMK